jgi:putative membrane protein
MRKISILFLALIMTLAVGCNKQRGNEPSTADNSSSSPSSSRADTGNDNANANTSASGSISSSDQQFVTEAATGGMKEVELSTFVAQKTQNADVKQLAERIAQDHTNANQELKTAAQQDNGQVPSSMDAKATQELNMFKKMSGTKLDQAYVQHMVQDHQKDISKFQQEANNGASQQVKSFAQKTLPTLQEHLQMAQDTMSKLGGGKSASKTSSNSGNNQQQ